MIVSGGKGIWDSWGESVLALYFIGMDEGSRKVLLATRLRAFEIELLPLEPCTFRAPLLAAETSR